MKLVLPRLYAIIDPERTGGRSPLEVTDILLDAGVRLIQYRDKRASSRQLFDTSAVIAERARTANGIFILNDRADIARLAGADGVHVGQDDLPVERARRVLDTCGRPGPPMRKIVGCSTHNLTQLKEADASSADYIAFGPIFATESKENPDPVVTLDGLRQARRATRKPLVAIGGITLERSSAAIEAGADSVAVIGDLLKAPDIGERAREFLRVLSG